MVRDATFTDIPSLAALLRDAYGRSKYASRCGLSEKAMDQMLVSLIYGQRQNGPGASFVQVVEDDGKVVGFMAGVLSRVYNISDKLCACLGQMPCHMVRMLRTSTGVRALTK
jgi:hypothetical protein